MGRIEPDFDPCADITKFDQKNIATGTGSDEDGTPGEEANIDYQDWLKAVYFGDKFKERGDEVFELLRNHK